MSVLIKGMKMPKEDIKTLMIFPDGNVRIWGTDIDPDEWAEAIEVPPHGRLIDADVYHKEIRERYESAREWYKGAKTDDIKSRAESALFTFTECSLTLRKMPTIIESEGIEDG